MNILFINISLRPQSARKILPVGLGYVMNATRLAGYDFDLLDMDILCMEPEDCEAYLPNKSYDVIAMGCIITGYSTIKKVTKRIKKKYPEAKIIVGNTVSTAIPKLILETTDTDIAVIGEGDVTFVKALDCLKNKGDLKEVDGLAFKDKSGDITYNKKRLVIEDIDSIPPVKWEMFDLKKYSKHFSVNTNDTCDIPSEQLVPFPLNSARGCIYKCTFCYHAFRDTNRIYRHRSPENIVKEMTRLKNEYGANFICFWDELTFYKVHHVEQFVRLLKEANLNLYWNTVIRGDLFKSEHLDLLKEMKSLGCDHASYSIESASADVLKMMDKKIDMKQFLEQKQVLDQAGITSACSAVFGYPNETVETIKETIDFCEDIGLYPSSGFLLPLPGTPMYKYAIDNDFITDEDHYLTNICDRQDLHLNMTSMSDDELFGEVESGLRKLAKKFNVSLPNGSLFKTTKYVPVKKN